METSQGTTPPHPTVSLNQAKEIIKVLAMEQSILLLAGPGVGKTDIVHTAAAESELPCTSLYGTQLAPEDVAGVPRVINERSVFCPPRMLIPENPEQRFCLFIEELASCQPDVQKSLHQLLLERKVGEHKLPKGSWVVAAGNRVEDKAFVRGFSSALMNRILVLHVHVDPKEWLSYAEDHNIRADIRSFISFLPEALMRPAPAVAAPFSTPRSWAELSRSLDSAEKKGILSDANFEALVYGRVSPQDAAVFIAARGIGPCECRPLEEYFKNPLALPCEPLLKWFIFNKIRQSMAGRFDDALHRLPPKTIEGFFTFLSPEDKASLLLDLVEEWIELGIGETLVGALYEFSGMNRVG